MRAVEDRGFNRGNFARHLTRLAGALAALATTAAHAQMSTPILNPATGNYYAYVTAPGAGITWLAANDEAATVRRSNVPGHLAVPTSLAENTWIVENMLIMGVPGFPSGYPVAADRYWLGGYQLPGSAEPSGGWTWVTGEPFNFSNANWDPIEPNNSGGEERLAYWRRNHAQPYDPLDNTQRPIGEWNDEPSWLQNKGYVVEWETPVPWNTAGQFNYGYADANRADPGPAGPVASYVMKWFDLRPGFSFGLGANETLTLDSNNGTLIIGAGSTFTANGTLWNKTVENAHLFRMPANNMRYWVRTFGGVVHALPPGQAVLIDPNNIVDLQANTLGYVGAGAGFAHTNGGIAAPGVNPMNSLLDTGRLTNNGVFAWDGRLFITGRYVQSPTGTTRIYIAGANQGTQYSRMSVQGRADLEGSLQVILEPSLFNYVPDVGATFDVINSDTALTLPFAGLNVTTLMSAAGAASLGLSLPAHNSGFTADPNQLVQLPSNLFTVSTVNGGNTLRLTLTSPLCVPITGPTSAEMCAGAPANFSIVSKGSGPKTYQWRKNGVNIGGATNTSYSIPTTNASDNGNYDCVVTSPCGPEPSPAATLTVNTAPTAPAPSNVAACLGAPASFTVTPTGGGSYTYQWRKGGINIGGATNATLNFPAVVPGDVGNYDCVVTNACGNTTSGSASLSINDAASIASSPSNQAVCANAPASFSVTASGTAPFTYQWRKGGIDIGGATNSTLSFASALEADEGAYDCVVTNACGSATSAAATLTVNDAATVASNPSNQAVCADAPASFSVVAAGTGPFTYQWRKGGVDIGGATNATLSFAAASPTDVGSYDCVVTNACGSATSTAATLTVNDAATVASNPSNATVCVDAPASFSVTAAGTAPFTYQWRKGGVDIGGATNSTLSFGSATLADVGSYDCVITNACGSVTSSAATLTVNEITTVASNPSNQTVCADAPASFTVTASGTAPFTYQWRKGGIDIVGATNATLAFAASLESDEGSYDCVITNACGSATSTAASLEVDSPASIASNPSNQDVCSAQPASFVVVAGGTPPYSYQWRKGGIDIVGATSSTLSFASALEADEGAYDCVVTNACGNATTTPVTLTVNDAATIASNPSNQTACLGAAASFSVTASGTAPFTYQWRKGGIDIVGATSSTLAFAATTLDDVAPYDCVVTNACGSATSTAATLAVNEPAAIASSPSNQTICADAPSSFSVTASGTAPFTYQWRKGGIDIVGATSSTLSFASALEADEGSYDCVVTNACGSATSAAATLAVDAPATVASNPSNQTVCDGAVASFSVTAAGTGPFTYQWYKTPGTIVPGETISVFTIQIASAGEVGSYYCVVTNACGSATSTAATLTVDAPASVASNPSNQTVCDGAPASFAVTAAGTAPFTYQWRKGGIDIVGATNAALSFAATTLADVGSYDCVITNACGSATSTAATLTVDSAATIASSPSNQAVCSGTPASFTVTASGTAPFTYQWRKGGVEIGGATLSTYTIAATVEADAGSFDCVVTNACGSATSAAATLTVNASASVTSNPSNQTVCVDAPASFSVTASGTAPITYQWRKGGIDIPGATLSTLSFATAIETDAGVYDCVVTNACGSTTSAAATLAVQNSPSIGTQPDSLSIPAGSQATFTVAATGSAPITYQWRKDETPLVDGGTITGATTASLTINLVSTSDVGDYDCVVTNPCGSVTSSVAVLHISGCPADIDDGTGTGTPDDGVDINDLLFFLESFEAGSLDADLDDGNNSGTPDGGVDVSDLLYFLAHFEAGC